MKDSPPQRAYRLLKHFLSSPALPSFAWIKAIELALLDSLGNAGKLAMVGLVFSLLWVLIFDDIEDVAEEMADSATEG